MNDKRKSVTARQSSEPKIILASASPRRRELIKNLKIACEAKAASCEEHIIPGEHPADMVMRLSKEKALWISERERDPAVVIGADTAVAVGDEVLGKPKDRDNAIEMLKKLSGRIHRVYTGITVTDGEKIVCDRVKTDVKFYELTDGQIERYVDTGEPMDKAGAYGIQKYGSLLVESIDGDYFNVVGLPVGRLCSILRDEFGIRTLI